MPNYVFRCPDGHETPLTMSVDSFVKKRWQSPDGPAGLICPHRAKINEDFGCGQSATAVIQPVQFRMKQ